MCLNFKKCLLNFFLIFSCYDDKYKEKIYNNLNIRSDSDLDNITDHNQISLKDLSINELSINDLDYNGDICKVNKAEPELEEPTEPIEPIEPIEPEEPVSTEPVSAEPVSVEPVSVEPKPAEPAPAPAPAPAEPEPMEQLKSKDNVDIIKSELYINTLNTVNISNKLTADLSSDYDTDTNSEGSYEVLSNESTSPTIQTDATCKVS